MPFYTNTSTNLTTFINYGAHLLYSVVVWVICILFQRVCAGSPVAPSHSSSPYVMPADVIEDTACKYTKAVICSRLHYSAHPLHTRLTLNLMQGLAA